jgi:sulfotransferase family protein
VFVVGCHRSGTNLLYDTLLSAGGFAIYRGYLPMYKMMAPKFGAISNTSNRQRVVDTWLKSKGYRRSGLDAAELSQKLMSEVRNPGDFMRVVMDLIAESQNAARWALYDADNLLFIKRIKADIPEAIFVHIIRDGRDIALSLKKMGGFTPFFWNRKPASLLETAIYWEWIVRKGQQQGREFPDDYIELHYEDLISSPRQTLNRLGGFLEHDLDYDRICAAGLGRLRATNSSFLGEEAQKTPVNRWKTALSMVEIIQLERLIGKFLTELDYPLSDTDMSRSPASSIPFKRFCCESFLQTKLWAKLNTPLGRLISISPLELEGDAQPRLA